MRRLPDLIECPFCSKLVDMVTNLEDEDLQAVPGDVSMCIACGEPGIFDHQMHLRKPSDSEYAELAGDPVLQEYRKAWLAMKEAEARGEIPR